MSGRIQSRVVVALTVALGPLLAFAACGGAGDDSIAVVQDDAATDDAAIAASETDDAAFDASANRDGAKTDARADAGAPDAAKTLNRCGGYGELDLHGYPVNPGDSCGACNDGTIACEGSNVVACAGATNPPCPTPQFDAGPNQCGGYGSLTFLSADAAVGDPCGECGSLECASATSLVCVGSSYSFCATDAGLASTCVIPSSAYAANAPSPTLAPETRPTVTSTTSIALPANALAYNPYDGYLYASISNYVTAQGNSVAQIDPMSATVIQTIYVGPNPTQLSISDNGRTLWVVVSGSSTVRRVDLSTFTVGASFALPTNTNVYGLQVLAGTEDSVAISSYGSYPYYGYELTVYDNGTPRPYAAYLGGSTLIGTPSASLLFAAYNYGGGINTVCADHNGTFVQGFEGQTSNEPPVFSQGVLYAVDGYGANGNAYDAQTGAVIHSFSPTDAQYTLIAVDTNDVYFLTSTSQGTGVYWVQVTGFNRNTYAPTITDLLATNQTANAGFIRWGRYGFAYITNAQSIEVARSTIIPDMP